MEDPRSWILFKLSFTFFLLQPDSDFTQTTKGKKQFQKCFFLANHFHLFGFPMEIQIKISVYQVFLAAEKKQKRELFSAEIASWKLYQVENMFSFKF